MTSVESRRKYFTSHVGGDLCSDPLHTLQEMNPAKAKKGAKGANTPKKGSQPSSDLPKSETTSAGTNLSGDDIQMMEILREKFNLDINTSSSDTIITGLLKALLNFVHDGQWQQQKEPKFDRLLNQQRSCDDKIDALWQRQLKGNFIINSPEIAAKGLRSIIKSPEELEKDNIRYVDHIRGLVQEHYGVNIPACDVSACHPLRNGSALLRVWNRKSCAAYHQLVSAVKCGGKYGRMMRGRRRNQHQERREMGSEGGGETRGEKEKSDTTRPNFFVTFHLTRRRGELVKHLKNLKREGKIFSFSSCEKGEISFKRTQTEVKTLLTVKWDDHGDSKTFYPREINEKLLK